MPAPIAILLAAGRGRRFAAAGGGEFKQTQAIAGGDSLLIRCCRRYREAGLDVLCALHPQLAGLQTDIDQLGCRSLLVRTADLGMGHSLASAIAATPSTGGWLIGLADMPAVQSTTIRRLADALIKGAPLCAPVHQGRRGHPVGFSARFGAELAALRGDQGARGLLQAHAGQLWPIEVDDPGVLLDIDHPQDLAELRDPDARD